MSSSIEQASALVLRVVDFGESDRVVTLLTRDHGRLTAMARGARKSKRRFAGALEGFALISVDLGFGRGALARLEVARVTTVFPRLLADLAALEAAGALLRLTRELLPERVPEPEVFDGLIELLQQLDEGVAAGPLRLGCEARLLALTGYAPHLSACVGCGKEPLVQQPALFDPARGGIICRSCGGGPERMTAAVRVWLEQASDGEPLATLAASLDDVGVREARRLMSLFVAQVLQREHKAGR